MAGALATWWGSKIFGRGSSRSTPLRTTALMESILDLDRETAQEDPAFHDRRREVARASKAEIERGIATYGVGGLGLSLEDIRQAEQELKEAGLEDWRIRLR